MYIYGLVMHDEYHPDLHAPTRLLLPVLLAVWLAMQKAGELASLVHRPW